MRDDGPRWDVSSVERLRIHAWPDPRDFNAACQKYPVFFPPREEAGRERAVMRRGSRQRELPGQEEPKTCRRTSPSSTLKLSRGRWGWGGAEMILGGKNGETGLENSRY